MPRNIIDSVRGTLDFLILKTLSWGERQGYAVACWIFDHSGEELQIEEGTLYPALLYQRVDWLWAQTRSAREDGRLRAV